MRNGFHGSCRSVAIATGLALVAAVSAVADGPQDHERARAALLAGEIRPLAEILQRVQPQLEGEMIAVELEREHGRWTYEFKLLQPDGRIVEWYVDARDATVLQRKVKPSRERRGVR